MLSVLFSALSLTWLSCLAAAQSPTNLPPAPPGVFTVQNSVLINATLKDVWDVLTDFPSYPDWNPFLRSITVADDFFIPTDSQIPQEGHRIILVTQIPPLTGPISRNSKGNPLESHYDFDNLTHVQPEQGRIAWKVMGWPDGMLSAERWNAVSEVTGEDGEKRVLYEYREVFGGALGYFVEEFLGDGLKEGFEAEGKAMKARVEGLRD
ncbi:hypothetical protein VKT23_009594 [Stygiomarasmius scandens]|uniref:Coenzyme Q-binding protein COQ10 START domain-containing protein n=1 Tax=Marasmiellus scandens TaxID=2682957 RepID=A0ABR1JGX4_9AGAR